MSRFLKRFVQSVLTRPGQVGQSLFRSRRRPHRPRRWLPRLEGLEVRATPVVTPYFDPNLFGPGLGALFILGEDAPDVAVLSTEPTFTTGDILLNGAPIEGGPTWSNTWYLYVAVSDGADYVNLSGLHYSGYTDVYAGSGNDVIIGSFRADGSLAGEADDDFIWGLDGTDSMTGGDGNDHIGAFFAGPTYHDDPGADTLDGGDGADTLDGGDGNDSVLGGADDDSMWGNDGADTLDGGDGYDALDGQSGNDTLVGQLGNDTLNGGVGNDSLDGGEGADTLYGHHGNDTLDGGAGNDSMWGGDGADHLVGGDGANLLDGQSGNDTLVGGAGNDTMWGNDGNDSMLGGDGADALDGQLGNDTLDGGAGNDTLNGGGDGADHLIGWDGADTLYGHHGNDTLDGGAGNDSMWGGDGADHLVGGYDDDNLDGQLGNDTLYGSAGNDTLNGGDGNDGLFGGTGADTLWGWSGADRFLFQAGDTINDQAPEDARVTFTNGAQRQTCGALYEAGTWTDAHVQQIDRAFAQLHSRRNHTRLLKTAAQGAITFERLGAYIGPGGAHGGCNEGATIVFVNASFSNANYLIETVFHEIGHNWDNTPENPQIGTFRALSGWRNTNPQSSQYTRSLDGNWWYLNTAVFGRNYGRTNPYEDFADSFAAYFMQRMGISAVDVGGVDPSLIPGKVNWVNGFLSTL